MTTPLALRLLYLGRNKQLPLQIDSILQQEFSHILANAAAALQFIRVTSQKRAFEEIRSAPPHAIFVEIGMGRYNRSRFCHFLRSRLPRALIIAVCRDENYQDGFSFDSYLCRPFTFEQVRTTLSKLVDGRQQMYLQKGDLHLDVAMRTVDGPLGRHHLPPKLCKLLQVLMENAGSTVRREELMQSVWNTQFLGDTRTLDVHVRWLREKIEPDPSRPTHLVTVRGQGYRLEDGIG